VHSRIDHGGNSQAFILQPKLSVAVADFGTAVNIETLTDPTPSEVPHNRVIVLKLDDLGFASL